jgi:ABC-type multidrug transport system ATPase subunit
MGATGSGKTTLINGMINYIFNVQWEDTFRFQLIQEQTAAADAKLTARPVASPPTTSIMRKDSAFRLDKRRLDR